MATNHGLQLDSDVENLKGVGDKTRQLLNKIGIYKIQDLLFYLPSRYQDRTRILPIGTLLPGKQCLIQGTIDLSQIVFGRRRSLLCQISDGTGSLVVRFFYFNQSQQKQLARGQLIRCFGQARIGKKHLELIHPEYQLIQDACTEVEENLTPVYPLVDGLHQIKIRKLVDQALDLVTDNPKLELLPKQILSDYKLYDLASAVYQLHKPDAETRLDQLLEGDHPAQKRVSFEELLSRYLYMQAIRKRFKKQSGYCFQTADIELGRFYDQLGFSTTGAQQKAIDEISSDLQTDIPMLRLLQGDVGSGKTLVAAVAAIQAITSGYQTALMAPTELLAEQHFETFKQWMQPLNISVCILTGKLKAAEQEQTLKTLESGNPVIVIGTHALFQKSVEFKKLGLVIIDEQHRFGVNQRLDLINKNTNKECLPHQLVMSATPIPRTLTMTAYADLDVSVIDELPPGRSPINTSIIANNKREELISRLQEACNIGRQIYWVCTLIEESENLQAEAATETLKTLEQALPNIKIGLIHGRMKSDEKDQVMVDFKNQKIQLLVATTVIEVGVNVPNATLMIIENAERMGLAQLHQLRGRVGRGHLQSDCILLYQSPLSELARKRLDTIRSTNDGFKIAETDLQLRGPGDMLGTRQAGATDYIVADLLRDADMLPNIKEAAKTLQQEHPEIIKKLVKRWCQQQADYSKV